MQDPKFIPMQYSGPSFINPESVLLICIFFAVSAIVGVVLSQSWLVEAGKSLKNEDDAVKKAASVVTKDTDTSKSTAPTSAKPKVAPVPDLPLIVGLWSKFQANGAVSLSDEEILSLVDGGKIPSYALEKTLGDFTRAVKIRRDLICKIQLNAISLHSVV